MFKKSLTISLLFAVGFAMAAPSNIAGQKTANTQAEPRLLWFKHGDGKQQQPIIIVQQPQQWESDRHHHHHPPHNYPQYYPYPVPSTPQNPPFQIPGLPQFGSQPAIIIVNPNNAQNLTFPAAAAASTGTTTTGTGTGGRSSLGSNPIVDLLQESILDDDTEVITAADNTDAASNVAVLPQIIPLVNYNTEDRDEDSAALAGEDVARGLSPKQLLSFLTQDKRRRRIQEAVASIYLRNYNLNRK